MFVDIYTLKTYTQVCIYSPKQTEVCTLFFRLLGLKILRSQLPKKRGIYAL